MSAEFNNSYTALCKRLTNEAAVLGSRIAIARENEEKRKKNTEKLKAICAAISVYKATNAKLKHCIADIVDYLGEKKKSGNMAVNAALLSARNVVPDSMEGIHLIVDGDEAWLESNEGLLMERMEGGGYRATCSLFMRKVALASSQNTMQFLILDELLAKLSPESSAIVSRYLPILAQDCQIIIIEQKNEVYSRLNCKRYHFFLAEGETIVREEEIKNGDDYEVNS